MNKVMKWVGLSFALLAIISTTAPFLHIQKAVAIAGSYGSLPVLDKDAISDLPTFKSREITAKFINRNQIKVTFPVTLPYSSSSKTFNDLFGGIYEDVNSDGNWEYISKNDGSSGTLDQLSDASKVNKSVEDPYHLGEATIGDIKHLELSVGFQVKLDGSVGYGIVFLNEKLEWKTISGSDYSKLYNETFDEKTTVKITPSNRSNFNLIGRYDVSAGTIISYESSDTRTFRHCVGDNTFRLDCAKVSDDYLTLTGTLDQLKSSSTLVSMVFANSGKTVSIAGGSNSSSDVINSDVASEDSQSCEGAIDNGFGWAICPILDGADKLINVTENTIQSKLEINSEFTDNKGLHDAWTQLARIASGLLVIVALVMIISTALGFDVVSSYTLKKMLPRIVIGAIGIWLSWVLATNYVNFMNDLGRGVADIMFSPFKDTLADGKTFAEVDLKHIVTTSFAKTDPNTDLAALGIFSVPVISLVFGSGGIFGILMGALSVITAMLIGLFLLTVRQILIVFLLVMAPIGVAAWMLPNTQRAWKLWSGTFNKLLLMYPLFMGAFAAGKIFALIAADATKTDNGVLEVIVPMLAYIAPFFFLPLLFKLAGNIFGNITGMVNDKSKGVFDRSRGYLKKKQENSYGAFAKNNRAAARSAQKQRKYSNDLTGSSPLASYRRFRAGGLKPSGRRDVLALASATARSTADKELESALSGDAGALKAVASGNFKGYRAAELASINGKETRGEITAVEAVQKRAVLNESVARAERLAGKHEGNRHSQAAALMQLANMGMAGEGEFTAVAEAFGGDTTAAGAVIGAAKQAAKSKGSISAGAINYQDGKVGYINRAGSFVPAGSPAASAAKMDAVSQIIRGLSSDGYAQLGVDTTKGPGKSAFRDPSVTEYFKTLNRDQQIQLLNNPSVRIPPGAVEAMQNTLPTGSAPFVYDAGAKVWG